MEAAAPQVIVPLKSPSDDREYRYIILANGIHALLVSDPETDKGAAACDVHVGSTADPPNLLGLAHFLGTSSLSWPERPRGLFLRSFLLGCGAGPFHSLPGSSRALFSFI